MSFGIAISTYFGDKTQEFRFPVFNIYSLNQFININLEGDKYES